MTNNTFGCIERECHCPLVDYDAECGVKGLGIFEPKDDFGCSIYYEGCRQPGILLLLGFHYYLGKTSEANSTNSQKKKNLNLCCPSIYSK